MTKALALAICLTAALEGQQLRFALAKPEIVKQRLESARLKNPDRERRLYEMFTEAGCTAERLTEQKVHGSKIPNVVCSLPGEVTSTIIVGAHFDCVDAGTGVIDNWSGASLLPSLFESMKLLPRRHNFIFVGFSDEEKGLVGSRSYVKDLKKEGLRLISAMVNLDSLASDVTKVETERGNKKLTNAIFAVADTMKLPLQVVNVHKVGRSDSDTFQDKKVPAINFHSLTQDTYPILHTSRDRLSAVKHPEYYDSYHLIAAYLTYLDHSLDQPVE